MTVEASLEPFKLVWRGGVSGCDFPSQDWLWNKLATRTSTLLVYLTVQWNPSITDTIGTSKLVLLIEVSGSFSTIKMRKYQNGTRKVSLVARCPLFRVVLYKQFYCISIILIIINNYIINVILIEFFNVNHKYHFPSITNLQFSLLKYIL